MDVAAEQILHDLVCIPEKRRNRGHAPDVKPILDFLNKRNVPITTPGNVIVPVTSEPLKVVFAYVNGAHHYVHPQGFPSSRERAIDQAEKLGAQGHMLFRHSQNASLQQKLVVFARFGDGEQEPLLRQLLAEMNVRLVPESAANDFAEEIAQSAREPDPIAAE